MTVVMRHRPTQEIAAEVWDRIARAGEDGLPCEEAMGKCTPAEFERGKAWIRDGQTKSGRRFVRRDGRYVVTNDEDEEGG